MHRFKDSAGREWSIVMNVAQARKLKDMLGLDVLASDDALTRMAGDPYTAANALYVLCERQCQEAGISDEQFGEALAGDAFEAGVSALLEELVDFFPTRQRGPLKKILAQLEKAKAGMVALAEKKAESPEMTQAMTAILTQAEAEIDQTLAALTAGNSSGNAPASPA